MDSYELMVLGLVVAGLAIAALNVYIYSVGAADRRALRADIDEMRETFADYTKTVSDNFASTREVAKTARENSVSAVSLAEAASGQAAAAESRVGRLDNEIALCARSSDVTRAANEVFDAVIERLADSAASEDVDALRQALGSRLDTAHEEAAAALSLTSSLEARLEGLATEMNYNTKLLIDRTSILMSRADREQADRIEADSTIIDTMGQLRDAIDAAQGIISKLSVETGSKAQKALDIAAALGDAFAVVEADKEHLAARIDDVENAMSAVQERTNSLHKSMQLELISHLEDGNRSLADVLEGHKALERRVASIDGEDVAGVLTTHIETYGAEMDALSERLTEAEERLEKSSAETQIQLFGQALSALEEELTNTAAKAARLLPLLDAVPALESQVSTVDRNIAALIDDCMGRIEETETRINKIAGKASNLDSRVISLARSATERDRLDGEWKAEANETMHNIGEKADLNGARTVDLVKLADSLVRDTREMAERIESIQAAIDDLPEPQPVTEGGPTDDDIVAIRSDIAKLASIVHANSKAAARADHLDHTNSVLRSHADRFEQLAQLIERLAQSVANVDTKSVADFTQKLAAQISNVGQTAADASRIAHQTKDQFDRFQGAANEQISRTQDQLGLAVDKLATTSLSLHDRLLAVEQGLSNAAEADKGLLAKVRGSIASVSAFADAIKATLERAELAETAIPSIKGI